VSLRAVAPLALASALVLCGSSAARSQASNVDDVRLAAQHLREDHPNLFHDLSRAAFETSVEELGARANGMGPDDLLVGLMRLAAQAGVRDGHTGIFPLDPANRRELHVYPVRLYTFTDGTYVVGQAAVSDLLRARLVAVGGRPLADVVAAVRPLVPRDNDSTLALRVPTFLATAEILHGLGIAPHVGPLTFTFERDGVRFDRELTPVNVGEYEAGIRDVVHPLIPDAITGAVPAYVRRRGLAIWSAPLASGRVFYVAYNDATTRVGPTAVRVQRAAKKRGLRGVVVDLRNNPGGDNTTYRALLDTLTRVSRTKRVVVLLSRATFSAAGNFASDLERTAQPVFVGEPSGSSPNQYGDATATALPASGLTLRVARIYWELSTPDDPRVTIEPQVPVLLTSVDFFAGRDPVLAAAVDAALAPRRVAAAPRNRFAYDRLRPLALRLGKPQTGAGVVTQPVSFDAGHGRKAGYWVHPAAGAPWPVVLFSPGSDGNARTQLPDARALAVRGIASLLVSPPAALVRCRASADMRAYANYVVGRRRALDLLPKLRGADRKRVAAVGFSYGAAVSATLAGVDHRLRGAVIQSGRAHLSAPLGEFCRSEAYRRAFSVLDPVNYVSSSAPARLLFQNGRQDPISPEADVDALVRAANGPTEQRWYDAPHELNDAARAERDAWLVELLLG
jgi:dienelactone hydrolase